MSLELLTCGSGGLQQAIAVWVDDKGPRLAGGDVPEIISAQLEHWHVYQQRWQWDNRGKAAGEAGFPAYLAWQKKALLHKGEVDIASDLSFDSTMNRPLWRNQAARASLPMRRLSGNDSQCIISLNQSGFPKIHASKMTGPLGLNTSVMSIGAGTGTRQP